MPCPGFIHAQGRVQVPGNRVGACASNDAVTFDDDRVCESRVQHVGDEQVVSRRVAGVGDDEGPAYDVARADVLNRRQLGDGQGRLVNGGGLWFFCGILVVTRVAVDDGRGDVSRLGQVAPAGRAGVADLERDDGCAGGEQVGPRPAPDSRIIPIGWIGTRRGRGPEGAAVDHVAHQRFGKRHIVRRRPLIVQGQSDDPAALGERIRLVARDADDRPRAEWRRGIADAHVTTVDGTPVRDGHAVGRVQIGAARRVHRAGDVEVDGVAGVDRRDLPPAGSRRDGNGGCQRAAGREVARERVCKEQILGNGALRAIAQPDAPLDPVVFFGIQPAGERRAGRDVAPRL